MKKGWLAMVFLTATLLPAQERVAEGVVKDEFQSPQGPVWVYRPEGHGKEKLITVLASPAGSRLFHGMALAKGDEAEFLPYAAEGMAVVAFATSGELDDTSEEAISKAVTTFVKSKGGVSDGAAALKAAAARYSFIDTKRVYAVGHSSAGTLALQLTQQFPSIKGCVAYAPAVDDGALTVGLLSFPTELREPFLNYLNTSFPGSQVAKHQAPVMLFHALDDTVVGPSEINGYVKKLENHRKAYTLVREEKGGHYASMIVEGIPKGIAWIRSVEAGEGPVAPTGERRYEGATLSLPHPPGMSTYGNKDVVERDAAKDSYRLGWRSSSGNYSELLLRKVEKEVPWEKARAKAEEIRKEMERKDLEDLSQIRIAPITEGAFRGYWVSMLNHEHKGLKVMYRRLVLWDRSDLWTVLITADEPDTEKALDVLRGAALKALMPASEEKAPK